MASGFGFKGGQGRCYPVWLQFTECMVRRQHERSTLFMQLQGRMACIRQHCAIPFPPSSSLKSSGCPHLTYACAVPCLKSRRLKNPRSASRFGATTSSACITPARFSIHRACLLLICTRFWHLKSLVPSVPCIRSSSLVTSTPPNQGSRLAKIKSITDESFPRPLAWQ